eukprot:TRINITY_DN5377_c0_g1_i1.p1 TRINITY_DN5377_c0_g1~~TRINITY_DN5377_c0_g1_i1.p1  ORF type:complete len:258 (+),score=52.82 TRINITY_DN5377_c0_g1_i1:99-872(+)
MEKALAAPLQKIQDNIVALQKLCFMRDFNSPGLQSSLEGYRKIIRELEADMARLEDWTEQHMQLVEPFKTATHSLEALKTRVSEVEAGLPKHMPAGNKKVSPIERKQDKQPDPVSTAKTSRPTTAAPRKRKRGMREVVGLRLVGESELASVPQYLRGRLTAEQINTAIEEYNALLVEKYAIADLPFNSKMNTQTLKKWEIWHEQENEDVRGMFFLEEKEVRVLPSIGLRFKTVTSVLRHLKRIKEVRGGKCNRLAVL